MSQEEKEKAVKIACVLACGEEIRKQQLAIILQSQTQCVTMTGDSINNTYTFTQTGDRVVMKSGITAAQIEVKNISINYYK
jgi:high-affinity K+ transport system ATPase subunit B